MPPPFLISIALLFFAFAYTGRSTRVLRRWLPALAVLPIMACAWVFSDPIHGRARASAHIAVDPPYGALLYDFSSIELVSYVVTLIFGWYAIYLLLSALRRHATVYRRQATWVCFGLVLDLTATVPGLLGYRWFGQRDSAPLWFGIGGLLVTWALSKDQLFDLVPIARDAVIDNLPNPIFVLDAKDRLIDANPAARALLQGSDPGMGTDVKGAFPEWPELGQALLSSRARRELVKPGTDSAYDVSEAALMTADGAARGRAVILREVTETRRVQDILRKAHAELEIRVALRTRELEEANASLRKQVESTRAAQAAAQASENKFRAIFDGAYELIGMLSPDGTLIELNRAALSVVGIGSDDARGKLFSEVMFRDGTPDLGDRLKAAVERAARGEFVRFEVSSRASSGQTRVIDFSLTPVSSDDQNVTSLVAEGRDISDRKRTEEENARLQAELYQAQKLDSIGRLAGGVAHDFNNLLTVILGNVDLARHTENVSKALADHLRDIEQASLSAASLTRQLLAFARRQIVEPKVIDLNGTVSNVQKLLARLLGEDIDLRLELEPELWRVRVDPAHAEQMLINLAVNARDAMPKGGHLTIRTENRRGKPPARLGAQDQVEGDYVLLLVSDEGVGIGADVLPQIFEPFFTTKPQGMGTGLGLSMVYGAMQQAFGQVDVASSVGRGSTFTLYFPRSVENVSVGRTPLATVPPGGTETVALVEDQALVRGTTKRQLESIGYRVLDFASSEEALPVLLQRSDLKLLITDLVLAGGSGRELAERLSRTRPDLRVLFISGYTEDVVLRHGIELGEVHFLAKPFNVAELARAVRRVLDARGTEALHEEQQPS